MLSVRCVITAFCAHALRLLFFRRFFCIFLLVSFSGNFMSSAGGFRMRRKVGPNSFCLQLVVTKQQSFAKPFSKKGGDCVRADTRARARRGSVCVRARRRSERASKRQPLKNLTNNKKNLLPPTAEFFSASRSTLFHQQVNLFPLTGEPFSANR